MKRLLALSAVFSLIAKAALAATVIYITSGTAWTVPVDWNPTANTIEVIGSGGPGGGPAYNANYYGGGGGAYAKISGFSATAGASIPLHFATIDCTGGSEGVWFNSAITVFAEGGYPGCNQNILISPGTGGRASASVGTTKFSGGDGQIVGGGGGAAGPHGAGASAPAGTDGGQGGNGFGGVGGVGSVGANGTEFNASHGSGGGGSGGGTAYAGGTYGGGAGTTGASGALGGGGLIVITYESRIRANAGAF